MRGDPPYTVRDKSGRMSYCRDYPAALRPYVPSTRAGGAPQRFKRSLGKGVTSITQLGAATAYRAAGRECDRLLALAEKARAGTFDPITPELIDFLSGSYRSETITACRQGAPQVPPRWTDRPLVADYEECCELLQDADHAGLVDHWRDWLLAYAHNEGYVLDPSVPAFVDLCRTMAEAACDVWLAVSAPMDNPDHRFDRLAIARPAPAPSRPSKVINGEAFVDIARAALTSPRSAKRNHTIRAAKPSINAFEALHGHVAPSDITRAMVKDWIVMMLRKPANVAKGDPMGLVDLVAAYEGRDDVPRLSTKTIEGHVGYLSGLWKLAQDDEDTILQGLANPFARHKVPQGPRKEKQERAYSADQLKRLFALPVFTEGARPSKRGGGDACYWVPLLALWTGARPEEVCQMMVADFITGPDGRPWVVIDGRGIHPVKGPRSLKTEREESGERTIPLHDRLIALGLMDYVQSLRDTGQAALFPHLRIKVKDQGDIAAGFGQWWSEYVKKEGILPKGKTVPPLKGLRHNWKDEYIRRQLPETAGKYIMGHKFDEDSAHHVYGTEAARMEGWGVHLRSVEHQSVDWDAVLPWTPPS